MAGKVQGKKKLMLRGMYITKAQNLCRVTKKKSYKRFGK